MSPKKIEFKTGETVVYPKHGVGEIISLENMEISSIKTYFYVVKMEQAKLTIRVPLDKQNEVGLRKISTKKIIEEVFSTLKLKPKIRRIMWSSRAQEYDTKIFSGEPIKIAEVVVGHLASAPGNVGLRDGRRIYNVCVHPYKYMCTPIQIAYVYIYGTWRPLPGM